MADAGNIETPESSSSTPATARNFDLNDFKQARFLPQNNKGYLESF